MNILDALIGLFSDVEKLEVNQKTNQIQVFGKTKENDNVFITLQVNEYNPYDEYKPHGYEYDAPRKRKVKNKNGIWIYVDETVKRYEMSEGDRRFVYEMYVYNHLTAEQINLISGIPQPYIFRFIKHHKLKPKYDNISRSERKIEIDLSEPFELDPFPTRSEWKVRREEFGLKNGENWRNSPVGSNPGKKVYGNGKTSAKKKLRKLERKEERKKRNIQKFNSHQNNRYGISNDNPNGTKDPYKKYRDTLTEKKNKKE